MQTNGLPEVLPRENYALKYLTGIDNYDIPTRILIGDPASPRNSEWSALVLKEHLLKYRSELLAVTKSEAAKQKIAEIFALKDLGENNGLFESWEVGFFYHMPLASVINSLSILQNSVLISESILVYDLLGNKPNNADDQK